MIVFVTVKLLLNHIELKKLFKFKHLLTNPA